MPFDLADLRILLTAPLLVMLLGLALLDICLPFRVGVTSTTTGSPAI